MNKSEHVKPDTVLRPFECSPSLYRQATPALADAVGVPNVR